MLEPLTPDDVADALDVSRETLERLKIYVELLRKWRRVINLIGEGTADDVWRRHILDCGQLSRHLPDGDGPVVDIGTGAGLPGLILAILGARDVHLIEADSRKCAFLREAARLTETPVTMHEGRAESVPCLAASVITARAVAPLRRLLELCQPHLVPTTICLFLKGKGVQVEIIDIKSIWEMRLEFLSSLSSAEGAIVKMESLHRVDASDR